MTQVLERLREGASTALNDTPVLFAYLFGSQATGRTHRWSDVDIAVYMEPGWDGDRLDAQLDLAGRFEQAGRVGNVEILILNGAPLRLQGRVLRDGQVIHGFEEPQRVAWASRTLREWLDFESHALEMDRSRLRAIGEGRR